MQQNMLPVISITAKCRLHSFLTSFEAAFPEQMLLYINGKNWPVYNQVQGRQSHSSKTAKITLVGLRLER